MGRKEKSRFQVNLFLTWNTENGRYSQLEKTEYTTATSEKSAINNIKYRNKNLYGFESWYDTLETSICYKATRL